MSSDHLPAEEMVMNVLVGKTITGIKLAADKEAILFETTEGGIKAWCDADCCSHTWVEHIELPALGFPALVISADDLDMNKPPLENDEYECLQYYGFKIVTDKGEIVIDYRNSSNGYYGGSLVWPGERHYGGVFEQNVSKEEWTDVA